MEDPYAENGAGVSEQWTIEFSINDGEESAGKYIESVTYLFQKGRDVKVTTAPFTISRLAE